VNGVNIANWTLTTSNQDYYADGSGTIEVHFTNDDQEQYGRDIIVDYIVYNGVTYQAEDQEINTGVYTGGDTCGGSYSDTIECDGYIRFETSGTGPTSPPTPTIPVGGDHGLVTFGSNNYSVPVGQDLTVGIYLDSGNQDLGAYGFEIDLDGSAVSYDTGAAENAIAEGSDGFISAANINNDKIMVSGFTTDQIGPGSHLHMLDLYLSADSIGTASLDIEILDLADTDYAPIGTPRANGTSISVIDPGVVGQGTVTFDPDEYEVSVGQNFTAGIYVNTGNQDLGAYGFEISFGSSILSLNTNAAENGVAEGDDGFISAANASGNLLVVSGFTTDQVGPGDNLHMLDLYLTADSLGSATLSINIIDLTDSDYNPIGTPMAYSASVTVTEGGSVLDGDANGDGTVGIVDALMTAQEAIGLNPPGFVLEGGDGNCDGNITIVDALIVAQIYVGLINSFPC
jgi:hypothetical protein